MDKERGREVLLEVAGVLDMLDIPFFLMQGTALGAYRDGGFVPWERDIDFGVLIEHLAPAADKLSKSLQDIGFSIRKIVEPFTVCRTVVATKDSCGIHADIVGFAVWNDKRFTATPLDFHSVGRHPWAIMHNREQLERHEKVRAWGREFLMPSPAEQYLESEYGPEWWIPKDDHVSRGRVYNFIRDNNLPPDFLEKQIAGKP